MLPELTSTPRVRVATMPVQPMAMAPKVAPSGHAVLSIRVRDRHVPDTDSPLRIACSNLVVPSRGWNGTTGFNGVP